MCRIDTMQELLYYKAGGILQYVFNNIYAPGAAQLQNQRSIRFTTEAPINYVSSLSATKFLFMAKRILLSGCFLNQSNNFQTLL